MNPSELGSKSYFSLKKNDLLGLGSCSRVFFFYSTRAFSAVTFEGNDTKC